jgi:rRNA maturation protein Nop10
VTDQYTLRCPTCGEEAVVDAHVRTLLLREGCVVCGGTLTPDSFEAHV